MTNSEEGAYELGFDGVERTALHGHDVHVLALDAVRRRQRAEPRLLDEAGNEHALSASASSWLWRSRLRPSTLGDRDKSK